jgi:hypothetical protein
MHHASRRKDASPSFEGGKSAMVLLIVATFMIAGAFNIE